MSTTATKAVLVQHDGGLVVLRRAVPDPDGKVQEFLLSHP